MQGKYKMDLQYYDWLHVCYACQHIDAFTYMAEQSGVD